MMMVVTWTIVLLLDQCKKNVFRFSGGGLLYPILWGILFLNVK